jgi:phosphoserine aminotransferase
MSRVYNFSAGPAVLPDPVLDRIRDDIPDWNGTGMSVMEVSHRSKEFVSVASGAERDLRTLLSIPDDYSVLFLQGGATLQFSMVPLNLSSEGQTADYVRTGSWSKKSIAEAGKYCDVNVVADSADENFTYVPALCQ